MTNASQAFSDYKAQVSGREESHPPALAEPGPHTQINYSASIRRSSNSAHKPLRSAGICAGARRLRLLSVTGIRSAAVGWRN